MKEIWKDVRGYEGLYAVSNMGRVKSLERDVPSNYFTNKHIDERILKGQINNDGYIRYGLSRNNEERKIFGHRLVMEAFAPIDHQAEVNHINMNKQDNRLENLEWVSHLENMTHAFSNKTWEHPGPRKRVIDLTTGEEYESGKDAAKAFSVNASTMSGACRGEHKVKGHILRYAE